MTSLWDIPLFDIKRNEVVPETVVEAKESNVKIVEPDIIEVRLRIRPQVVSDGAVVPTPVISHRIRNQTWGRAVRAVGPLFFIMLFIVFVLVVYRQGVRANTLAFKIIDSFVGVLCNFMAIIFVAIVFLGFLPKQSQEQIRDLRELI